MFQITPIIYDILIVDDGCFALAVQKNVHTLIYNNFKGSDNSE